MSTILLNKKSILDALKDTCLPIGELYLFDSLGSTNDFLKTLAPSDKLDLCLTEQQTAGRGRHGRTWHSPANSNIYFSCRWCIAPKAFELNGLSLVIGLALLQALENYGIADLGLKWPNDVLWQGKKLAGILIETQQAQGQLQLIIGIGINVNMEEAALAQIQQPWTSLSIIKNETQDRNGLIVKLIEQLSFALAKFAKQGLTAFLPLWEQYDVLKEKYIEFLHHNISLQGLVQGLDKQGNLLIEINKETRAFASGEILQLRDKKT